VLRAAALCAVLAGAVGSVGFMLHAGSRSPQRLLLVIVAVWVLAPFMVLVFAEMRSKRWSALTRQALHVVMLVVSFGALAVYWNNLVRPRRSQPAFVFVLVPMVSWVVTAAVVSIAAFISRRRSQAVVQIERKSL
jgi:hypothetical protein